MSKGIRCCWSTSATRTLRANKYGRNSVARAPTRRTPHARLSRSQTTFRATLTSSATTRRSRNTRCVRIYSQSGNTRGPRPYMFIQQLLEERRRVHVVMLSARKTASEPKHAIHRIDQALTQSIDDLFVSLARRMCICSLIHV